MPSKNKNKKRNRVNKGPSQITIFKNEVARILKDIEGVPSKYDWLTHVNPSKGRGVIQSNPGLSVRIIKSKVPEGLSEFVKLQSIIKGSDKADTTILIMKERLKEILEMDVEALRAKNEAVSTPSKPIAPKLEVVKSTPVSPTSVASKDLGGGEMSALKDPVELESEVIEELSSHAHSMSVSSKDLGGKGDGSLTLEQTTTKGNYMKDIRTSAEQAYNHWYKEHSVSSVARFKVKGKEMPTPVALVTDLVHGSMNAAAFGAASLFGKTQDLTLTGMVGSIGAPVAAFNFFQEQSKKIDDDLAQKAQAAKESMNKSADEIYALKESLVKVDIATLFGEEGDKKLTEGQYETIMKAINDPSIKKINKAEKRLLNAIFRPEGSLSGDSINYVLLKGEEQDSKYVIDAVDNLKTQLANASLKLKGIGIDPAGSSLGVLDNIKILFAENKWNGMKETAKYAMLKTVSIVGGMIGFSVMCAGALAGLVATGVTHVASRACNLLSGLATMFMSKVYEITAKAIFLFGHQSPEVTEKINSNVSKLMEKGIEMLGKAVEVPEILKNKGKGHETSTDGPGHEGGSLEAGGGPSL